MIGKIERIQAFAEVSSHGSFTAAAKALNMSPPAVTRLVAELERELGVQLLLHTTRRVAPTSAGRLSRDGAAALLKDVNSADEAVRAAQHQLAGTLRVS